MSGFEFPADGFDPENLYDGGCTNPLINKATAVSLSNTLNQDMDKQKFNQLTQEEQQQLQQQQLLQQHQQEFSSMLSFDPYLSSANSLEWFDPSPVMMNQNYFMNNSFNNSMLPHPQLTLHFPIAPVSVCSSPAPPMSSATTIFPLNFEHSILVSPVPTIVSSSAAFAQASRPASPSVVVDKKLSTRRVKECAAPSSSPEPMSSAAPSRATSPDDLTGGHSYKNNKRFRLPKEQMTWLKEYFNKTPLPTTAEAEEISREIGVEDYTQTPIPLDGGDNWTLQHPQSNAIQYIRPSDSPHPNHLPCASPFIPHQTQHAPKSADAYQDRKNVCYISFPSSSNDSTPAMRARSNTFSESSTPTIITKVPASTGTPYLRSRQHSDPGALPIISTLQLHGFANQHLPPSQVTANATPRLCSPQFGHINTQTQPQNSQSTSYKTFSAASQFKLSNYQRKYLEKVFSETQAPTGQQYQRLCEKLQMPRSAVMAWFQTMRAEVRNGRRSFGSASDSPTHVIHSPQLQSLPSPLFIKTSPPPNHIAGFFTPTVTELATESRPADVMSIMALI
ncbi:UNVERIFIED_CONTAM: hypothetical protein HDU68_005400 [Siphonaria sp. JEL0065]|nr:hypothetical protein HDU68_005400 [Siphonaria sp. JEL0065]